MRETLPVANAVSIIAARGVRHDVRRLTAVLATGERIDAGTAVAWGLRVARCESGYNPRAYNGAGPYYGLFQFLMSTFKATPYGGQVGPRIGNLHLQILNFTS